MSAGLHMPPGGTARRMPRGYGMVPASVRAVLGAACVGGTLLLPLHPSPAGGKAGVLEAERAICRDVTLVPDSSASGGAYVRMDDGGSVSWSLDVPDSGWYDLLFRYRARGGEREEYLVSNGRRTAVGFGQCDGWSVHRARVVLRRGENTIALEKSWGFIDIDHLTVIPAAVSPVLSPRKNIRYTDALSDISLTVKRFGFRLDSISWHGRALSFTAAEFPYVEDADRVTIARDVLWNLPPGDDTLVFAFEGGMRLEHVITIAQPRRPAALTIVAPDVGHGSCVLFTLPDTTTLLVDCGKSRVRDSVIIPFLQRHGIGRIDHFIITHYDDDHDGGDRGEKIKDLFSVGTFIDYESHPTGATFDLGGTTLTVLNSYADGHDENTRSLSFRLEYRGFVYVHGADTYAENQKKIMARFPSHLGGDVFYANHHFHGSTDPLYLRAVNPVIILLQAEQAIYARSTYMVKVREQFECARLIEGGRFLETLPAIEVGTVVVRVEGYGRWTYEMYGDTRQVVVPALR